MLKVLECSNLLKVLECPNLLKVLSLASSDWLSVQFCKVDPACTTGTKNFGTAQCEVKFPYNGKVICNFRTAHCDVKFLYNGKVIYDFGTAQCDVKFP